MGANASIITQSPTEIIKSHDDSINCIAVSDDGSLLVTGSDDTNVRMWSVATKKTECLGVLKGHTNYITSVAIYDTLVFSASADGTIRKWDMTTCECLFTYHGHQTKIMKIFATSQFIFSASYDKTVRAWHVDDDNEFEGNEPCFRIFKGHTGSVLDFIFIPGINVPHDGYDDVEINPSDLLLTGSADRTAKSWSFKTGKNIKTFKGHTSIISCMVLDQTGKVFYTGSADYTIRAWHISRGECIRVMEGHRGLVIRLLIRNKKLYSSSADGTAICWNTEFGDLLIIFRGHHHSVASMKLHRGILFTASGDAIVRAFDSKTGFLLAKLEGHQLAINDIAVIKDKLYSGSSDYRLLVWNIGHFVASKGQIVTKTQEDRRINFEKKQNQKLQHLEDNLDMYYPEN